ncbi:hypothetical protein ACVGOW_24415 [Pseudonocardia saturnea]
MQQLVGRSAELSTVRGVVDPASGGAGAGPGGAALLDGYDAERRPVGLRNARSSLRPGAVDRPGGLTGDLGVTYRSAVNADGTPAPMPRFARRAGGRTGRAEGPDQAMTSR